MLFPMDVKHDINPSYKKNDPSEKANYRAIKILPILSKALKRLYD